LDSLLVNSEENSAVESETPQYVSNLGRVGDKDNGSWSGSDVDMAQEQLHQVFQQSLHEENCAQINVIEMETNSGHYLDPTIINYEEGSNNWDIEPQNPYAASSMAYNLFNGLEGVAQCETGIKIRTRQPQNQETVQNFATQGNATRRIRLQKKLQIGPVSCRFQKESNKDEENIEEKPTVAKLEPIENIEAKDVLQMGPDASSTFSTGNNLLNGLEESRSGSNVVESGDSNLGTGIKIRTRQPIIQESFENVASQGNLPRRIRLQKKLQIGPVLCSYKEKPPVDETEIAEKKHTHIADDDASKDVILDGSVARSNGDGELFSLKKKGGFSHILAVFSVMPRVLMILGLVVVFFGLWGGLKS